MDMADGLRLQTLMVHMLFKAIAMVLYLFVHGLGMVKPLKDLIQMSTMKVTYIISILSGMGPLSNLDLKMEVDTEIIMDL